MKLPRRHLQRLRRKLRRSMTAYRDLQTHRLLEEWSGPRRPPHSKPPPSSRLMKIIGSILLLLVLAAFVFAFAGCATVTTRTTVTDSKSGLVTVTEITTSGPDRASVNALAGTASAFAPRAVIIDTGGK